MEDIAELQPDRVTLSAIGILVANAGLLFLYVAYDLTLYQLVIVYWWECLWIGVFSALKLIVASMIGDPYENRYVNVSGGSGLLLSFMTIMTFGGAFMTLVMGLGIVIFLVPNSLGAVQQEELLREGGYALVLGSILLATGHGLSFVINFLFFGEYREARVRALVVAPFKRCFSLLGSIAIVFAVASLVPELASMTGFAAAIIVLKLLADYRLHMAERKAFRIRS